MNTIVAADSNPAASPGSFSAIWLSRLRAARGYDPAVRVLGGAWFLLLALAVGVKALIHADAMSIADFSPTGWPALLASICSFMFYLVLFLVMLLRPSPAARIDGILPSLIAFLGSYLPWTILLFAPGNASSGQNLASAALLLFGTISTVVVILHLGRSFSIVPQARRLVRTGPYALVRNPLYFAEEVALLGILLQYYTPVTLALFLAHGALQVCRIHYEENLLRRTFSDYDDYARSTSRLIPHIW